MMQYFPSFVGRALRNRRAGEANSLLFQPAVEKIPSTIVLTSSDFVDGGELGARHTADGEGSFPSLSWLGCPDKSQSILLFVEDLDSPTSAPIVHLIAYDIDAANQSIGTGELSSSGRHAKARFGRNSMMGRAWMPPDPPPGHGPHRYLFQLYALGVRPPADFSGTRNEVQSIVADSALGKGVLTGLYERK